MPNIYTTSSIQGLEMFKGRGDNRLSGTADYGDTSSSWNTQNTNYIFYKSGGTDPARNYITFGSQTQNEGWSNYSFGTTHGRYLTGDFVSGFEFKWRTYHNEAGGIAIRRYGVGIVNSSGTKKRWSSSNIDNWSTSSTYYKESTNFSGSFANLLSQGWRINEFHIMLHTPKNNRTPGRGCEFALTEFYFRWKSASNVIIPCLRPYNDREKYAIASV